MKLLKKILSGIIVLITLTVTGCATVTEKSFLEKNNIAIKIVNTGIYHIENINVTKTNNRLSIHGKVKRHGNTRAPIVGHVDVEVINSSGKVLSKSKSQNRTVRTKVLKSMFVAVLDIVPEKGSIIKISYHKK